MDFKGLVNYLITTVITPLFSIFLGAAIVFFMWNIFGVIKNSDQPEELAKFKSKAVWGVVAIAVMVSMWGLVNFLKGTFQLQDTAPVDLERFNQPL